MSTSEPKTFSIADLVQEEPEMASLIVAMLMKDRKQMYRSLKAGILFVPNRYMLVMMEPEARQVLLKFGAGFNFR